MGDERQLQRPVEDVGTSESFRFELFVDTASAQPAFQAAYPLGSPIEPALQALVVMGAHLKTLNATRVACRYVEREQVLACFCWHLDLECNRDKAIEHVRMAVALVGM